MPNAEVPKTSFFNISKLPNREFSIFHRPNLEFPNLEFSIFGNTNLEFPNPQFSIFGNCKAQVLNIC